MKIDVKFAILNVELPSKNINVGGKNINNSSQCIFESLTVNQPTTLKSIFCIKKEIYQFNKKIIILRIESHMTPQAMNEKHKEFREEFFEWTRVSSSN
jgi:hypothetical protein